MSHISRLAAAILLLCLTAGQSFLVTGQLATPTAVDAVETTTTPPPPVNPSFSNIAGSQHPATSTALGCTEANRPDCPPGREPVKQILDAVNASATCHWVCQACPNNSLPAACPAGQFRRDNPAGHCQPWTCRDCDFNHRDLPACQPDQSCPNQTDWGVTCAAGQYRRAVAAATSGCLIVECASCEQAAKDAAKTDSTGSASASQLPAECQQPCPEPLVLCAPGTTVELGLDAKGCRTATCRPCREQEACAVSPNCDSRGRLDFEVADCQPGLFHLAVVRIDGCSARFCLPCPTAGPLPPSCRQLPAACIAPASPAASLPNCTAGSQQVQQEIDANGCPSLVCADCPAERPACPAGQVETPRPTKWLQCQRFDCKQLSLAPKPHKNDIVSKSPGASSSSNSGLPSGSGSTSLSISLASSSQIPRDSAGCPVQPWRQPPSDFTSEWVQLGGGSCRLRRYRACAAPTIACRVGELPQLTEGCEYACQRQNWTSAIGSCFPGPNYIFFVVDTNKAKSPFQIRFQVASFIARLASQLSYGPSGVQIGAICYSGRVVSIINPDECPTVDAFFRRLLLLHYEEDSATATGEAVAAAAAMLDKLRRPEAQKSVVVITDSVTNSGRSLKSAAALLPAGTKTYFVNLSPVWNAALHAEAVGFVSDPANLAQLTSYYLLSTSGVQQLFPLCYRECDSARTSLDVRQQFLHYLHDSVHQYEAWLYSMYASISQLQEGLETLQYQFESKQIRLELCTRMLSHYKATVQRLQDQLDSLHSVRGQALNTADYETNVAQVQQLEQRVQSMTVRKTQLMTLLRETLVQVGSVEDRLEALRREQEAKLAAENSRISSLETKIATAWETLQTITQELLIKRMAASNSESMVKEKEARIQDVLLLNTDMAARIETIKKQIELLKASTNSSQLAGFISAQKALTSCQAVAELDGFSSIATIRAGSGVRFQEVVDSLLRGVSYSWMAESQTAEKRLFVALRNFTVGAYSQVKLLFRNSAGESRAHLTFQAAAFDFTNFFSSSNLVASFPWRLESVKETLDLSWHLRSDRFPSLAFSILTRSTVSSSSSSVAAASSAFSVKAESQCASRKGLLAMLTDKDGCEDLPGPYPRFRFARSGRPSTLAEMEDLDSLELLAKPLATDSDGWLPGLVASADMPVTLGELLSNSMLAYPASAAPTGAPRPGQFFKSQLLRSRPLAFPLVRVRLTTAAGNVSQLVYSGAFDRDSIVESTWSRQLLSAARLFTADPPFAYAIGDAAPCQSNNASGVLYFNLDNRCPTVADARRGWSVLLSGQPNQMVDWSRADRAAFVEISLKRLAFLASASSAATAAPAAGPVGI